MKHRARVPFALGAGLVAVATILATVGGPGAGSVQAESNTTGLATAASPVARRVVIISVPTLSFSTLNAHALPNLGALLDASTIADLTVRGVSRTTSLIDGYVTLGAGTRAEGAGPLDGRAFNTNEVVGGVPASELYTQRTGLNASDGIVHLGIGEIINANASRPFDADVGALGGLLASRGWARAVIANGDTVDQTSSTPIYHREAAASLMDHEGHVPGGDVSTDLLMQDPAAPYGQRLDAAAVDHEFAKVWQDRSVVLVEASDLVRYSFFRGQATPAQQSKLLASTLRWTDDLIGRIMARVDLAHDAVIVVAPAHDPTRVTTTVTGVRARFSQEWPPGLADSGTTRRAGFVQLVDVAPTVLQLVGDQRAPSMEGRSYQFATRGGTAADRRAFLAAADLESQFRDRMLVPVYTVFLVLLAIALLAATAMIVRPAMAGSRGVAWTGALGVLCFFPAVLFASVIDFSGEGVFAYWAFVAGALAVLVGALALVARGVGRFDALLVALALLVLVLGVDVLSGSHLEWISTLGYSPTGAGRFTGMGNLCYSAFAAGGLILGVLVVDRFGARARPVAFLLYVALIVVNGAPMWGSDIGGVLSLVPALGVTGWYLAGGHVRKRTLALVAVIAVAVLAILTGLDLLRPASSRTHLGRLAETAAKQGWPGVWTVISRKAELNIDTWGTTVLGIAVPLVLVFVGWLGWLHRDRLLALRDAHPPLAGGSVGLAILVILGFALNDSGIAIPGVMLGIAGAVLVVLLLEPAAVHPRGPVASDLDLELGPVASTPVREHSTAEVIAR